jgi:hypothetical protein
MARSRPRTATGCRDQDHSRTTRLTRLSARVRSGALDRALIAGADPAASMQLAARASYLTARPTRNALADALEARVRAAEEPVNIWRVASRRAPVRACARTFAELAVRLRAPEPLYAGGLAAVSELLSDGTGPLYGNDTAALAQALSRTVAALAGQPTVTAPAPGRA